MSTENFSFNVPDAYSSSRGYERDEGGKTANESPLYGTVDWVQSEDINELCSRFGFYQENAVEDGIQLPKHRQEHRVQTFSDFKSFDDSFFDVISTPCQASHDETPKFASVQSKEIEFNKSRKEKPYAFPLISLGILQNLGSRFRKLNGEKKCEESHTSEPNKKSGRKSSIDEILRLAAEKFIQSCSQGDDDLAMLSHPYARTITGLSDEEARDVDLVHYLLASAEKVGQRQFERASKLLNQCDEWASDKGNSVQRLVYYFSEALQEKIDRETERITQKGLGKNQCLDLDEAMMGPNVTTLMFFQKVPFFQVCLFTAMQAIVENVAEAKRVHFIDLYIRNGLQCTVLMQAFAARTENPLEYLKITAVGTKSRSKLEETGKRLIDFAQSLNLPFSFNVIMVTDMLELSEDLIELDAEEAVAIYSSFLLRSMIAKPDRLDHLMRLVRKISPRAMVVTEVEANMNSPVFVNRFIETVFFYGAFFESIDECMDRDDPYRTLSESIYFSQAIRNIVAAEGEERYIRHVKINVWREFFSRFAMEEAELSSSSLYQASLVAKKFTCGNCCTFGMDGKCLLIGWKGTPLLSVSSWKFL